MCPFLQGTILQPCGGEDSSFVTLCSGLVQAALPTAGGRGWGFVFGLQGDSPLTHRDGGQLEGRAEADEEAQAAGALLWGRQQEPHTFRPAQLTGAHGAWNLGGGGDPEAGSSFDATESFYFQGSCYSRRGSAHQRQSFGWNQRQACFHSQTDEHHLRTHVSGTKQTELLLSLKWYNKLLCIHYHYLTDFFCAFFPR